MTLRFPMLANSSITSTIPYDQPGVLHGHLHLPHSRDDSAYGAIMIPISVINNGQGPTVLLTGGNHGDEYYGPLALTRFLATVDPATIIGRVIVVPYMNYPAFSAGARTSPIDAGNLNRVFPGSPTGTVTQRIADYMTRYLLPMADAVLDIHDGGRTLEFMPMASTHVLDNKADEARNRQAAAAFGAPFVTCLVELDQLGMWDCTVEESGTGFVTTELGGGGTTRPDLMRIASQGVVNVLRHWGAMTGTVAPAASAELHIPDDNAYVISAGEGLIEWLVNLGDPIAAGQPIAQVYSTVHLGNAPEEILATMDGVLAMRHYPGTVKMGDAIAMQATLTPAP